MRPSTSDRRKSFANFRGPPCLANATERQNRRNVVALEYIGVRLHWCDRNAQSVAVVTRDTICRLKAEAEALRTRLADTWRTSLFSAIENGRSEPQPWNRSIHQRQHFTLTLSLWLLPRCENAWVKQAQIVGNAPAVSPYFYVAWTEDYQLANGATTGGPGIYMSQQPPNTRTPHTIWTFDGQFLPWIRTLHL